MKRAQFEPAIRAAGAVLGVQEVLPPEASRSIEVDVAAMQDDADGRLADLIDGSIGEASVFHATFGYYAQGVVETIAVPPEGGPSRLVVDFDDPARQHTRYGFTTDGKMFYFTVGSHESDIWVMNLERGGE